MATATVPTSIRLNKAEKKRIAMLARERGLSPTAYIKRAALGGMGHSDDAKLARLEGLAASLLEAVEDERDARAGDAAWDRHLKSGSKLLKPEEVWRELGV